MDVAWFAMGNGGDIVQSTCSGTTNQTWRVYWGSISSPAILIAEHSGKAMDVLNASTAHAADVVQWDYQGFSGPSVRRSQMWWFNYVKTENGIPFYQLMNLNSGRCLDVAWFSQANGGNVLQATCTGTDNQLWDVYNITADVHFP